MNVGKAPSEWSLGSWGGRTDAVRAQEHLGQRGRGTRAYAWAVLHS